MKKICGFVLFLVVMVAISVPAFAESNPTAKIKDVSSTANASVGQTISQNFDIGDQINSSVTTDEKRQMVSAYPGAMGGFVNAPMTPDMKSWVPIIGDPHFQKISNNKLKNLKVTCPGLLNGVICLYDLHLAKEFMLETTSGNVAENEDDITILQYPSSYIHQGDEIIQTVIIVGDPRFTDEAPIYMALKRVKEQSHSRRVYLEARLKSTNMNEGLSLATGATGAVISQSPDNVAGAIALGGLIGKTWAYIWKNYDIQVKALNDGSTTLPAAYAKIKKAAEAKAEKEERILQLKDDIELLKLTKEKNQLEKSIR